MAIIHARNHSAETHRSLRRTWRSSYGYGRRGHTCGLLLNKYRPNVNETSNMSSRGYENISEIGCRRIVFQPRVYIYRIVHAFEYLRVFSPLVLKYQIDLSTILLLFYETISHFIYVSSSRHSFSYFKLAFACSFNLFFP